MRLFDERGRETPEFKRYVGEIEGQIRQFVEDELVRDNTRLELIAAETILKTAVELPFIMGRFSVQARESAARRQAAINVKQERHDTGRTVQVDGADPGTDQSAPRGEA
jgi:hypothetical protein